VFSKSANWSSGVTPVSDGSYDLLFAPAALPDGNYSLNLDQSFSAKSLSIGGSASSFTLYSANGSALTLGSGATLATSVGSVSISNTVFLQNGASLVNQLSSTQAASLAFNGSLSLLGGATLINLGDRLTTTLNGNLDAASPSSLSFAGTGRVVFNGSVGSSLTSLEFSGGSKALFLTESALPSSLSLSAGAGSTIAVRGNGTNNNSLLATVLARITSPSSYAGQLNLESSGSTQSYSGTLDFSAFSSPSFRLGTETSATIAAGSVLTATPTGYRFGGGGGTLYVATRLTGANDIWLGADDGTAPSLFLQSSNSFTGNVHVSNALLYLDAFNALPGNSTVFLGSSGYVSFTPAWNTSSSLGNLISRVSKTNNASTAVIGFDASTPSTGTVTTSGTLDLSGFANPIWLGSTTSDAIIASSTTLKAPVDGILRLAALRGATLEVRNNLVSSNGVSSLLLGHPDTVLTGTPGTYILSGSNNYTGGTRVNNGTLELASSSATPAGSGTITLSGATLRLGNANSAVRASDLSNAVVLEGSGNRITGSGVINTGSTFTVSNGNWLAPGYSGPSTNGTALVRALGFRQALSFGQGGGLEVIVSNPGGTAGVDYSLTGSFDTLSFNSTQLNPFTFKLVSYSLSGNAGTLQSLSIGTTYNLVLAMASHGITGFDASAVALDTSAFLTGSYSISNYSFSVKTVGGADQLILSFTPIPEPETWALMALGSASLAIPLLRRLRRRRQDM
jgi:autotransporter-associated beta strand protein